MMKSIINILKATGTLIKFLLFYLLLLVIMIIAMLAKLDQYGYMDENFELEEESNTNDKEQSTKSSKVEIPDKKSESYNWTDSIDSTESIETKSDIISNAEIMQRNSDAYYRNEIEVHLPNYNVQIMNICVEDVIELEAKLAQLYFEIDQFKADNSNLNLTPSKMIELFFDSEPKIMNLSGPCSPTDSEFLKMVSMMREGVDVVLVSPSTHTQDSADAYNLRRVSTIGDNAVIVDHASSIIKASPKKPVFIATRRVEEGDPIPPLPMWSQIPMDSADYHIRRIWERRRFVADFANSHVDSTKPSSKNQEWMENESDYNINKLFEEKDEK